MDANRSKGPMWAISVCATWAVLAAPTGGCLPTDDTVPVDGPRYPTGLTVTPSGEHLLVVSSNFDLAFDEGALLVADLDRVRKATENGDSEVVVDDAYISAAFVPSFGDAPVVSSDGSRVLLPSRGANLVTSLELSSNGGVSCDAAGDPERCGEAPRALQLPANDPFGAVLLSEQFDNDGQLARITAMATLLSSPEVFFFTDDSARTGSQRMQILGSTNLGEGIIGVRSVVLRPAQSGSARTAIAAVEIDPLITGVFGGYLAMFEPENNANVTLVDVTAETGAFQLRDLVLVPGADGDTDALVVILRQPDALARYEIDDDTGTPIPRLAGLAPSCRTPTSLALAEPVPGLLRLLLTCQEGDAVQMIDPNTLHPTDAVRFEGRAPYDVTVNNTVTPPEAYVSFFLDNSVGVLTLAEGDEPSLVFRGRIGEALPRREDGRE